MKKYVMILCLFFSLTCIRVKAQSDEAQQLLLNVEKLTQLKKILSNMYKGYEVVSKGYNSIKDISKGNFNLHEVFLDALFQVSHTVRKYKRIPDIIKNQSEIIVEYKSAFKRFQSSNLFNVSELNYMSDVYKNLFNKSLKSLDELSMVITAGKLRMSDDERITAIDKIYNDMSDKLVFLRSFNKRSNILAIQRGREMVDTKISEKLNGL